MNGGGTWDTGPFCAHHWHEAGSCDLCETVCRCGHRMSEHESVPHPKDDTETGPCKECECARWSAPEASP